MPRTTQAREADRICSADRGAAVARWTDRAAAALLNAAGYTEHVKAWRWHLYEQGISVDAYGHWRCSRTGALIKLKGE